MPPSRREFLRALGGFAAGSALVGCNDNDVARAAGSGQGADFPGITPLPFAHGVASGDPLADRVIIWTRLTPRGTGAVPVTWEMATDPQMLNVVRSGTQSAVADRDWTVKVDVTGLAPATSYYYRFSALGGVSITGRTRTAPATAVSEIRFAVLSCSSYWSSYWSGLGHIANRNDLDLVVHCGDYIYDFVDEDEGVRGRNGIQDTAHPDYRDWLNIGELRRRYALWRSDPNNLRAHQQHPWFIVWDNHDLDEDYGNELDTPFDDLKSTTTLFDTTRVFYEWTPTRPVKPDGSGEFLFVEDGSYPQPPDSRYIYRKLSYGPMLDVIGIDTQIYLPGHKLPVDKSHLAAGESLFNRQQFEWFTGEMLKSSQAGVTWRFINNQTWIAPADVPAVVNGLSLPQLGISRWTDYKEERAALFQYFRGANPAGQRIRNNIFVSGDAHGNWASDLVESDALISEYLSGLPLPNARQGSTAINFPAGYQRASTGNVGPLNLRADSVGVEFAPTSMGRGGADELVTNALGIAAGSPEGVIGARAVELALISGNKNCQFVEWVDHGYGIVHIEAGRAVFECWWQDKLTPESPDVLGQQLIAYAQDDALALPPQYRDQIDAVSLHGMSMSATAGTRTAAPAPEGELKAV